MTKSRITDDQKRRLIEHLLDQAISGITGRDRKDLVDVMPSRSIFAGVLQPPRQADRKAAESGTTKLDPPVGSALGIDFRIRPTSKQKHVTLTVALQWSLYYPIFPTWEEALRSNGLLTLNNAKSVSATPSIASENVQNAISSAELQDGDGASDALLEVDEAAEEEDPFPPGRAILPRVWRRYEVGPFPVRVELSPEGIQQLSVGEEAIKTAIQEARTRMLLEPRGWKHLGEPSQCLRELGDLSLLKDANTYSRAVGALEGVRVAPPEWSAKLQVESRPDLSDPEVLRIRTLLMNDTAERDPETPDIKLEERSLLDAKLSVAFEDARLQPFEFLLAPKDYRSNPTMPGKGINCTATWNPNRSNVLETETVPIFRQKLFRTRQGMDVNFEDLDTTAPFPRLELIAEEMEKYLIRWDLFLKEEAPPKLTAAEIEACTRDRNAFATEIKNYRLGIASLKKDSKLCDAFRLMNRTFVRIGQKSKGKIRSWRLFQLGFIVSQLPSLAVREWVGNGDQYSQEIMASFEEVGVLWFPTGGGKTEAYLGIIALAQFYDRLRGKTRGLCAWMRFPLRMLSLQQMERLARVIAVMNEIRAGEPTIRDGDPFAVGYFVGEGNTPNSVSEDDMRSYETSVDRRARVTLLRKCPFCESRVEVKADRRLWRLSHVCSNNDCFSNLSEWMGSYKGSLPLCIVDNEIYRLLPSVLVGTVDKLAIVGRNKHFVHLIRGVKQRCLKHGYTSYDECIERWSGCTAKKKNLQTLTPIKDAGPSLLIQDELHLLKAELGVFNGHYEGLLKYLCTNNYLPPKILAATATIESYDSHAFHIYLSRSRRYPQPAWEQGESFYATSTPEINRRFFIGILGHTRAIHEPILRILALYQREIRRLKYDPRRVETIMQSDPFSDEEIQDTLRLYDFSLCYVNRKSVGGSIIDKLARAVNPLLDTENLGEVRGDLLTGDLGMERVGATLDRIERERQYTGEPRLDVVAATNLISHGVDLERINMMAVCGMPSHYAEYVQSTSRAARSHAGLVFVCFKARDPRETSQYEFFPQMHEHLDRLIEPVAVNRFASFAPRKTIPGLLAGVLLCDRTPVLYGTQISKPLDHVPTLKVALGRQAASTSGTTSGCVNENSLRQAIEEIIGVEKVRPPASSAQIRHVQRQVSEVFDDLMSAIGRSLENKLKDVVKPLTSFRDVDEGIDFGSLDSASLVFRIRGR